MKFSVLLGVCALTRAQREAVVPLNVKGLKRGQFIRGYGREYGCDAELDKWSRQDFAGILDKADAVKLLSCFSYDGDGSTLGAPGFGYALVPSMVFVDTTRQNCLVDLSVTPFGRGRIKCARDWDRLKRAILNITQ